MCYLLGVEGWLSRSKREIDREGEVKEGAVEGEGSGRGRVIDEESNAEREGGSE